MFANFCGIRGINHFCYCEISFELVSIVDFIYVQPRIPCLQQFEITLVPFTCRKVFFVFSVSLNLHVYIFSIR